MTQVVPALDSTLPLVTEAREKLGEQYGYVSLEGYIVGKMWLEIMSSVSGPVTREEFLRAVKGRRFNLGGIALDFTTDNQGSDLVVLTHLTEDGWRPMPSRMWSRLLR